LISGIKALASEGGAEKKNQVVSGSCKSISNGPSPKLNLNSSGEKKT
jgi:hypothetical protein